MNILLTGGAGYVGSHAAAALVAAGHRVTVLDNLSQGRRQAVAGLPLIEADVTDRAAIFRVLADGRFDAVMHFAALRSVGESVTHPDRYYRVNVVGSLNLLDAMAAAGCRRLVFSSSAAVYGAPRQVPIPDDAALDPVSPYGQTKLAIERALRAYAAAGLLGSIALRYFNAAGAADGGRIGEDHRPEGHLIPIVLQAALGQRDHVAIFGADYDTPDGTCVRDYVHVMDLAAAHVLAAGAVDPACAVAYNVGIGQGYSVRAVIDMAREVTGRPIAVQLGPRRPGDPPVLVARSDALVRDLHWSPQHSELRRIIASAWAWHSTHPNGYAE